MSAHIGTSFANVVAFYGDPLPHEMGNRGYMSVICAARLSALRSIMGEDSVISYRAPRAASVLASSVRRTRAKKAAQAPASEAAGLIFERLLVQAKGIASWHAGNRWDIVPGASQWVSIPTKLAHYKFKRADGSTSMTIKNRREFRAPAPCYWPNGVLPDGVTVIEHSDTGHELQRARGDRMRAWMAYRPDFLRVAPYKRDADGVKSEQWCSDIRTMWQARRTLRAAEAHERNLLSRKV